MKNYYSIILILFFSFHYLCAHADDNLKKTLDAAAAALQVQEERIKVASENIANEDTTGSAPNESPYRRKVIYVKNEYDPKKKNSLLKVKKYDFDKSDFKLKHEPNHPAADAEGNVKYPNVNREIELADIREAKSSHAANVAVIESTKQIIKDTLEIMK